MPRTQKFDVHQEITNRIVDAIETAEDFRLPWIKSTAGSFARPVNIASKNPYNGVNIVSLWVAAFVAEYPSNIWGTYRQWQDKGCQVRRGEKSALVVFHKLCRLKRPTRRPAKPKSVSGSLPGPAPCSTQHRLRALNVRQRHFQTDRYSIRSRRQSSSLPPPVQSSTRVANMHATFPAMT